ncbi:uncharacterized protein LOC143206991 [Lasioglossum baleicum]|uniref:uncharacterized protein LOC143206991 n=1 Tax=Lasioglossum baleicum TaxID=434251 RepID=UPI003FCE3367
MSDLNDSVIICETLPSSNQQKTTSTKEKKKKAVQTKKKTFYECSLRHIQLSGKRWEKQMTAKQRLNSNKGKQHEVENNENNLFLNVGTNSLCQDSIIILSDNESEKDKDVCKNKGKTEKRYVERLDNNSNKTLKRKRSPILLRSRKRKSIYILDTEEDSDKDNENLVTSDSVNQNADDIAVVWSSKNIELSDRQTKESNIVNEGTANDNLVNLEKDEAGTVNEEKRNEGEAGKETMVNEDKEEDELEEGEIRDEEKEAEVINVTQVEDNRLFMIDCSPDPKNLHCLITAKRYKENVKDNDAREAQINDDTDLLFNQANLKLPIAQNISGSITMEKPKSFHKVSAKLKKRLLKLKKDTQPSTSSVQNATSNNEPLNSVLPGHVTCSPKALREIVIDGNNVAMSHTNGKSFSEKGLQLVINFFKCRGHSVKVFVPQHRRSATSRLLEKWYSEGIVVFTPSRSIAGKRITPYDDRYILQYATMCKGIVVSSDQFRDLYNENPGWRDTIVNRLLAPTFVGDIVMFPDDPLGRKGPSLKEFLRH